METHVRKLLLLLPRGVSSADPGLYPSSLARCLWGGGIRAGTHIVDVGQGLCRGRFRSLGHLCMVPLVFFLFLLEPWDDLGTTKKMVHIP